MFRSIFNSLFQPATSGRKRSVGHMLSVEALEDRLLLSAMLPIKGIGTGGGVGNYGTSSAYFQFGSVPSSVAAGSSITVTVTEIDAATGQIIATGGASSASLSIDIGNTASPAGTVTLTDGVGDATVTFDTQGVANLEATSGTAPSAINPVGSDYVSGYSSPITVNGPATHFVVTTASTETAGSSFTVNLTAEDAANVVVTSYNQTPSFTASDGYKVSCAGVVWANGVGTATVTLNNPGDTTLTASSGAVTGTSAAISVNAAPYTSGVWAGYAIQAGSGVTAVGGSWVQPAITGANNAQCAIWVGIDGNQNGTVEQCGTWATMVNGHAQYVAWFEFFGDCKGYDAKGNPVQPGPDYSEQVIPGFAVNPGDTISAEVSLVPGCTRTFNFTMIDYPASGAAPYSKSFHETMQHVTPQRSSAEWIVENPNQASQPLADFAPVTFAGCWATINSTTGPINAFTDAQALTMTSNTGNATPSAAPVQESGPYEATTSSFTVNYGTTAPSSSGSTGGTNQADAGSNTPRSADVVEAMFAQDALDDHLGFGRTL